MGILLQRWYSKCSYHGRCWREQISLFDIGE
nr:MAG TPA: hypothetical protein [Bacteriophage sp.]DAL65237.1 MAG TPA_asm: hypothetical protein [Caudoviricetes sp.]